MYRGPVAPRLPFRNAVLLELEFAVVEAGLRGQVPGADEEGRGSGVEAVGLDVEFPGDELGGLRDGFPGRVLQGPSFVGVGAHGDGVDGGEEGVREEDARMLLCCWMLPSVVIWCSRGWESGGVLGVLWRSESAVEEHC